MENRTKDEKVEMVEVGVRRLGTVGEFAVVDVPAHTKPEVGQTVHAQTSKGAERLIIARIGKRFIPED